MDVIINGIGDMASFIGSLTVVGSALLWLYNQFISKPREKRRERIEKEYQEKMLETIKSENKPLIKTINKLSAILDESTKDTENLNRVANVNSEKLDEHEKRLDNHNNRLIVLESKTGLRYKKEGD